MTLLKPGLYRSATERLWVSYEPDVPGVFLVNPKCFFILEAKEGSLETAYELKIISSEGILCCCMISKSWIHKIV